MDFTQMIELLSTIASYGDFFKGFGATLSGSADILTGSGDMAEGLSKLVTALGADFTQNLITGSLESGSAAGSLGSSGGSLGSIAEAGSSVLGSSGS